jgi:hypothetical protein
MDTATGMTLQECSTATGVAKSTIFRALKGGRLSGARDINGVWKIERCELLRAFVPLRPLRRATVRRNTAHWKWTPEAHRTHFGGGPFLPT